jgi:hypothetical protein
MKTELDLMDWKSIERNATASINEHNVGMVISQILLDNAKKHIKLLHGKTLEEEEAILKENAADPYHQQV